MSGGAVALAYYVNPIESRFRNETNVDSLFDSDRPCNSNCTFSHQWALDLTQRNAAEYGRLESLRARGRWRNGGVDRPGARGVHCNGRWPWRHARFYAL